MFNPGLSIGEAINNSRLCSIFGCSPQGGMRKSNDCFWATVISGNLKLKEAESSKWLTKDTLDSVQWLPADITIIDKIKRAI